jgi:hypothetical protein
MADYRAFTVGPDGHFVGFKPMKCVDDAEAIERAKRILNGQDIELWCGPRLSFSPSLYLFIKYFDSRPRVPFVSRRSAGELKMLMVRSTGRLFMIFLETGVGC